MSNEKCITFGSWEKDGQIHSAIRFPIIGGGEMLIQVSMPPKEVAGSSPVSVSRLALGIPLGALTAQDLVDQRAKRSGDAVNAVLEALSKQKEQPELIDTLKKSSDEDVLAALKFLAL